MARSGSAARLAAPSETIEAGKLGDSDHILRHLRPRRLARSTVEDKSDEAIWVSCHTDDVAQLVGVRRHLFVHVSRPSDPGRKAPALLFHVLPLGLGPGAS